MESSSRTVGGNARTTRCGYRSMRNRIPSPSIVKHMAREHAFAVERISLTTDRREADRSIANTEFEKPQERELSSWTVGARNGNMFSNARNRWAMRIWFERSRFELSHTRMQAITGRSLTTLSTWGQIVYIAKHLAGNNWHRSRVPKKKSAVVLTTKVVHPASLWLAVGVADNADTCVMFPVAQGKLDGVYCAGVFERTHFLQGRHMGRNWKQ